MDDSDLSTQAKGGRARANAMTKAERAESARTAALARWSSDLPQATHDGILALGGRELVAAVLPNAKRLLSQGTFLQAIGRSRTPKAGTGGFSTVDALPFFLQAEVLKPFISEELLMSTTPILFRLKNGQRTVGYDAMLLPMVCEVYLNFRDKCAEDEKPVPGNYKHIVQACDRLLRSLARDGIKAMVDLATGYQADKAKEELLRILEAYISPVLLRWTRRFPHEFFRQVYRIHGWDYRAGCVKHPQYLGKFINRYVYEALPDGVLQELREKLPKNENGNRKAQLWRLLTSDTGIPHLDHQITITTTVMQLSTTKREFERQYQEVCGRQPRLPYADIGSVKALPATS